jgi:hypothetical protein
VRANEIRIQHIAGWWRLIASEIAKRDKRRVGQNFVTYGTGNITGDFGAYLIELALLIGK